MIIIERTINANGYDFKILGGLEEIRMKHVNYNPNIVHVDFDECNSMVEVWGVNSWNEACLELLSVITDRDFIVIDQDKALIGTSNSIFDQIISSIRDHNSFQKQFIQSIIASINASIKSVSPDFIEKVFSCVFVLGGFINIGPDIQEEIINELHNRNYKSIVRVTDNERKSQQEDCLFLGFDENEAILVKTTNSPNEFTINKLDNNKFVEVSRFNI